ncbi:acyl carrier protein [Cohnella cellulosilytica]|uniref:Acyl carrier protein n=1 Tax=Cohnella cellulosilytica TaxID=986710 RepID=A0ABW2FAX6_9BACL
MDADDLLKELIVRNAAMPCRKDDIADGTDLVNDLALDSMSIVNLFADLEEAFDIEIDVREMTLPIMSRYGRFREFVQVKSARTAAAAGREHGV